MRGPRASWQAIRLLPGGLMAILGRIPWVKPSDGILSISYRSQLKGPLALIASTVQLLMDSALSSSLQL